MIWNPTNSPEEYMTKFEIYLGLSRTNAPNVGQGEVRAFVAHVAAPYFRNGLTFTFCEGYWEDKPEPSCVITIVGPEAIRPRIYRVANAYANRYDQSAVMVTETRVSSALILQADDTPVPLS
jgi:hypothetical protein